MQIAVIDDKRFAYEERNGNVGFNLTMMAKPYGKKPVGWLRLQSTKDYLRGLSKVQKSTLADLVEVRRGGVPEQTGTWANDYRVAVRFAQWLDVNFAIAVDELVFKFFTKQAAIAHAESKYGVAGIVHDGRLLYPYADIVRALGGSSRAGAARRRQKFPRHFAKLFGRNFITPQYVDMLAYYYRYRNAQLSLWSDKGGLLQ